MHLHALDVVVLIAYAAGVVAFGLWSGRRPRGFADFAVGARSVPWGIVLLSIVATETSTVTFLSVPGLAHGGDLTFLQLPLGYVIGRLLVVALLLPAYFRGNLITAYEVLHARFGGSVQRAASILFLVARNSSDGLRLFLTAIVLQEVADLDLRSSVVAIGTLTILYTVIGGMRAVVWTDAVQFVIYIAGAIAALAVACDRVPGGITAIADHAAAAGKLRIFDLSFAVDRPYTLWAGLFGGAFLTLGTHGTDQLMVQRYLCARSQRQAGLALSLSGVVVLAQFALFLAIGTALWAQPPARDAATAVVRPDRVFAQFIVRELPPGLVGLLLGAVLAAAMSTLSSSLNSSATTTVHDLLHRRLATATDAAKLRLMRALTIVFGAVQIAIAMFGEHLGDSVVNQVLAIAGFTTGLVLGVFFLGVAVRRATARDAFLGLLTGFATLVTLQFSVALAWPWFALVGSLVTFATGALASRWRPGSSRA